MTMLMKNNKEPSKRAQAVREPALKAFSDSSNQVDIPAPHRSPSPIYDETPSSVARETKVITVGAGVVLSGRIIEADHVKLEGTADGEITSKIVELSAAGSLDGNVKCETFIVAGTFSGEAAVTGSLSVKSTGKIEGKISYGSLAVEAGGAVLGSLEQGEPKNLSPTPLEEFVGPSSKPG
jgi:cytoskeletal protein CcmA (bactofilin family)